jgi:hypothetical protein
LEASDGVIIRASIENPELDGGEVRSCIRHDFPTTSSDLHKSLAAIRLDGTIHSRFIVAACDSIVGELINLPKEADLNELNYLALQIEGLNEDARAVFSAVMQSGEYATLRDAINVTENIGCFYLQPAMSPEILGEFLLDTDGEAVAGVIGSIKGSVGDEALTCITGYIEGLEACVSKDAYGRRKADGEHGHFTDAGYLTRTDEEFVEIYNTPSDIPEMYRVFSFPDSALIRKAIEEESGKREPALKSDGAHAVTEARPDGGKPSLVDRLIRNKQQTKAQQSAPQRDGGPAL